MPFIKDRLRRRAIPILAAISPLGLASEPTESLTEFDYFDELPVVITGTRLHQTQAASPVAMTLIDREMIEASGAREIYELFRLVPGVQVGSPTGIEHVVTYHGLSDSYARRMQILIDGRSVYHQGIGGVEWTEVPLSIHDVERIEFIRGSNAATYGSNAFLGTINIITRHPSQDHGTTLAINRGVGPDSGDEGLADIHASYANTVKDWSYRLSLDYLSDDGFVTRNDSKIVRGLNLTTSYRPGSRDNIDFQLGYSEGPRNVGDAENPNYLPGRIDRANSFQHVRWNRLLSAENEFTLQFYHNLSTLKELHRSQYFEPYEDNPKVERFDVEFFNIRRLSDDKRAVWGMSARRDLVSAETFFNDPSTRENTLYRLFGHLEWQLTPSTLLNLGLMAEDNSLTGFDLSPRVALNYTIAPGHTLRASYSRALRTPILFEDQANMSMTAYPIPPLGFPGGPVLTYTSAGNLDAEAIVSRELGYIAEFDHLNLTLDLKLYRDSLTDLIAAVQATDNPNAPAPPPREWNNRYSATIQGFEAALNWRPTRRSRLILNYAYADADIRSGDPAFDSVTADSVPYHTASALAMYNITPRLKASANFYYLARTHWVDMSSAIPAYRRLDLRLGYDFALGNQSAQIALVAQDILGEHLDFSTHTESREVYYLSFRLNLD